MSTSPHATSAAENPFRIYGDPSNNPSRSQPFPGGRPVRRRPVRTASVAAVPLQLQPSQVWHKKKKRLNSRAAWLLTLVLFFVTFALMLAPATFRSQIAATTPTYSKPRLALHIPSLPFRNPLVSRPAPAIIPTVLPKAASGPQKSFVLKAPIRRAFLSSRFGHRWGRAHQGVDLAAITGTPIYSVAWGKVIYSGWESGYGKSILIDHGNGLRTRYAHCATLLAKTGDWVDSGKIIAKVGSTGHSTGPHLHFEVIVNGQRRDPGRYYSLTPHIKPLVAHF